MRIRKNTGIEKEEAVLIANCSDALAHPVRVELFKFIYNENMDRKVCCNKDLVENFGYAQSTISQHMSRLIGAELIEVKKSGTRVEYYVNLGILQKYLNTVKKLNEH